MKLGRTRVQIENVFGLLKGRFRQLLLLEFWSVNKATQFIFACAVLHHLCIEAGDTDLDEECAKSADKDSKTATSENSKRETLQQQLGEDKRKKMERYLPWV